MDFFHYIQKPAGSQSTGFDFVSH